LVGSSAVAIGTIRAGSTPASDAAAFLRSFIH